MKQRFLGVLALGMISTLALSAQPGHRTPPTAAERVANQVVRLTSLLTLTPAQQASATTIFTTEQTSLDALRTSMTTARTALTAAVQKNDANGITMAATTIGALTTQQVESQAKSEAAFYALLTADQQTKYNTLRPGRGGFGGPGGPGGMGGGGFAGPAGRRPPQQ